jgi:hypothetical protein
MARVRGMRGYERLSDRDRAEYGRVLEALSRARSSTRPRRLGTAAREAHTSVRTIRKWVPEAVTTDAFGALAATRADRAFRPVSVIQRGGGVVEVSTRGSRRATVASEYAHTLDLYRAGLVGPEAFQRFEGRRIGGVELETDPDRIDELDATGRLDDFEFYADLP